MLTYKRHLVTCGKLFLLFHLIERFSIIFIFLYFFLRGTYKMEREDGSIFEVRIPSFYLDSKEDETSTNNENK